MKSLFQIFISMMKIGVFTFGGGYAMISLLENEFVSRKKWIESDEFLDLVTIAESTPGPIAINCSTYVGYKREGILGAVFGTLGMCIPSFTIIFVISVFFDRFMEITWVASAFSGIQVCVIYLILSAGYRMFKKIKKNAFNLTVIFITFSAMVAFSLFAVRFSTIFYILIFGVLGLSIYLAKEFKSKKSCEEDKK
ncbi:MAG: chromate transporter [Ruminococcaceae bacterium]|nr:chromate transporter [Oscillospiraceae bacterium]